MIRLAIFASGSGSNAQNIAEYFSESNDIEVSLILSNNSKAYVLERAHKLDIPTAIFSRDSFYKSEEILKVLANNKIDFIILAGFMWLVPRYLVEAYPNKILNIHPALLPNFGGKGMYGDHVHKAVKAAGETESGITIHYVNEKYDEGNIIFQAKCQLTSSDTPETIAEKVHALEYEHYPKVIETVIQKSFKNY
ncbi:phosphoribosylglycinamide formyltransferase [Fulvivirga lutea]|uniref:Phosphoribosylglycinamide formyltransferase n=1 Tax=Fulvivirga lutea TaxID=2810512 RepID=A0A974WKG2_9BACT|nr:phosphoribosylglycinamide formyltransferase [Fulvivirga lutea]QSE97805.1 phosphoribosylglycinamide formyltransferase [Fulvivirga lutea]